jgi:putative restriction endonuclease
MTLSPIERIRLDKAAVDEGFGLKRADDGDWLAYDSLGAPASIRLTIDGQSYVVAVNHNGVVADLSERWRRWPSGSGLPVPKHFTAFVVTDTAPLHLLVREIGAWRKRYPSSLCACSNLKHGIFLGLLKRKGWSFNVLVSMYSETLL